MIEPTVENYNKYYDECRRRRMLPMTFDEWRSWVAKAQGQV